MEQNKNLLKALAQFQYECPIIHKDTSGFNYTYADLPKIISTITPLLQKHGLCFSQPLVGNAIRTIIYHVDSGEYIESMTEIPLIELAKMNVYQSFGSGITYYRRYALSSILGLVTDKDIDASGEQVKVIQKETKPKGKTMMNDIVMAKLMHRYTNGEKDVFKIAEEHYVLRQQDIDFLNTIENN
jgi:hypothetical protein